MINRNRFLRLSFTSKCDHGLLLIQVSTLKCCGEIRCGRQINDATSKIYFGSMDHGSYQIFSRKSWETGVTVETPHIEHNEDGAPTSSVMVT